MNGNVGIGTWLPNGALVVNGNVGIGSTAPGQALDVKGTVRDIGELINGNMGIGTSFINGTGEAALTVMNGNVGIGTWVPVNLFQVGNGVTPPLAVTSASTVTTGGNLTIGNFGNVIVGAGSGLSWGGSYPEIIGETSPSSILMSASSGADLHIDANGNIGIGTGGTVGGMAVMTGNVGIGTWIPALILDVNGTVRMKGFTLSGNGAASGYVMVSSSAVGVGTWMSTTTLPIATVAVETTGDVTYYSASNSFAGGSGFQTNGTNVGIGTSNLTNASLQVVGNIGIGTVKNGDNFINTAPPNGGMIVEGNVGIGTWTPMAALEIGGNSLSGSGAPLQLLLGSFSNGAGYPQLIGNWNNNLLWGIGQATASTTDNAILLGVTATSYVAPFSWSSTGLNVLVSGNLGIGTITPNNSAGLYVASGNVGIGSATPGQKLDVQGTARVLGELVNGNVGIGTTFINGTGESSLTVMNGNVGVGTWAGGGALVVMNGNVGIGTVNPTYQLAVAKTGNINTLTTNKSTFMAVSYGTGAGASDNKTIAAATFTQINFHSLTGYTLIDNGGNYNATNDYYVTPVAGTYMIITKFRITDSQTQFISYGQGAGTSMADTPTFLWCQTATTTATRNGSQNIQFQHYPAGSDVEMFVYTNTALDTSDGAMQIFLVTAD